MDQLPCGHVAETAEDRACVHLTEVDPPDHFRVLTGAGMRYDLLCERCAGSGDPRSHLIQVCIGCVIRVGESSEVLGWRGQPEIRRRDTALTGTLTTRDCAASPVNVRCLAALAGGWLVLTADGLVEIPHSGDLRTVGAVEIVAEPANEWAGHERGPALHTSQDGRFAAIVTDYGRYGTVVDVSTGCTVLTLDRGEYHVETTPFPLAFLDMAGKAVVVAATDWNRLDVFDAATGRLLTKRDTAWEGGEEPRPEHYLDYFHGALRPSPHGEWLLDDGWVWSPAGIPRIIDAEAWLYTDRYASEHGVALSQRAYAWDQPTAWIDDKTVAIQRIGQDDEAMVDGVEVYDAASGLRTGMFAGPAGPMWGYDGMLFVVTPAGLEVWDPSDGARIGLVKDFRPAACDPRTGTFAELAGGRLVTWTR